MYRQLRAECARLEAELSGLRSLGEVALDMLSEAELSDRFRAATIRRLRDACARWRNTLD